MEVEATDTENNTFHRFSKLPSELKTEIWKYAYTPHVIEVWLASERLRSAGPFAWEPYMGNFHTRTQPSALLSTCRESREAVLPLYHVDKLPKVVSGVQWINYEQDWLYISLSDCHRNFSELEPLDAVLTELVDSTRIRHLMVGFRDNWSISGRLFHPFLLTIEKLKDLMFGLREVEWQRGLRLDLWTLVCATEIPVVRFLPWNVWGLIRCVIILGLPFLYIKSSYGMLWLILLSASLEQFFFLGVFIAPTSSSSADSYSYPSFYPLVGLEVVDLDRNYGISSSCKFKERQHRRLERCVNIYWRDMRNRGNPVIQVSEVYRSHKPDMERKISWQMELCVYALWFVSVVALIQMVQ